MENLEKNRNNFFELNTQEYYKTNKKYIQKVVKVLNNKNLVIIS
jgi:hypothetical protein